MPDRVRRLIGRDADVDRACALLVDDAVRLLTLVGPGGVGKTTLALAIADRLHDEFADGMYVVDLAPVHDPSLVLPSIAHALSVSEELADSVRRWIGSQKLLLLLDNFEQVCDAAPVLSDLLANCPELRLLITSREPLAIAWEQLFEVEPLVVPDENAQHWQELAYAPAIALFADHARAVRPQFALGPDNVRTVAEICRRLDGLPLAIELAAARSRLLSPDAMLLQLEKRPLALLSAGARDAPARHRTLRDAIAWSYSQLDSDQQVLFRRLSVFRDGCTRQAIEYLHERSWPATAVDSLVDKHLLAIRDTADEDTRYYQLETIREFAAEQLTATGEADEARAHLAAYVLELVESVAPGLYGSAQGESARRLLADHNNIRAALDACVTLANADHIDLGLRVAGSLWLFWRLKGFVGEGRSRLAGLLAAAGVDILRKSTILDVRRARPSVSLARALHAAGYLAFAQGAAEDAHALLTAAVEIARVVDDQWTQSYALHGLGHAALLRGDFGEARSLYGQRLAMAQKQQDTYALGQVLNALGEVARCLGEPDVASGYYEQSLAMRRQVGDTRGIAMGLANLGHVLIAKGDVESARRVLNEALVRLDELGHEYGQAVCVLALSALALEDGRCEAAARLLGAASAALERVGNSFEPPDRLAYERATSSTRAALKERFDKEFSNGRQLSLSDALALGTAATDAPVAPPSSTAPDVLTDREREVVMLIARGFTSDDIARALVMTRRTADTHAGHIRSKLNLRSRAQIAAWAIQHGLA